MSSLLANSPACRVLALAKLRLLCRCTIKYIVPQLHFTRAGEGAVDVRKNSRNKIEYGETARLLVSAIASLREPRTTMGGVNLVAGFRPELWSEVAPEDSPSGVHGFNADLIGVDGY